MNDADQLLTEFNRLLQKEANEKVKQAMQLFIRVDDIYKCVVLHGSGFSGGLTAKALRDHFDALELMDMLDDAIFEMQDELDANT